jgi:hypothetical protein
VPTSVKVVSPTGYNATGIKTDTIPYPSNYDPRHATISPVRVAF